MMKPTFRADDFESPDSAVRAMERSFSIVRAAFEETPRRLVREIVVDTAATLADTYPIRVSGLPWRPVGVSVVYCKPKLASVPTSGPVYCAWAQDELNGFIIYDIQGLSSSTGYIIRLGVDG